MGSSRRLTIRWAWAAALALLLMACGGGGSAATDTGADTATTAAAEQAAEGGGAGCADSEVAALIEEVAELEGEERETALVERAAETADGAINLYTEIADWEPIVEAFDERYGDADLSLNVYRAPSDQIRQRVLEESAAGFAGADLLEMEALEMVILGQQGILAPSSSPFAEDVVEAGQFENFSASRFSYILPLWNTDQTTQAPQSLQDFTDDTYGNIALEDSDVYWFAVLVNHLQEEEGMTEEEAVDLFRQIAANSTVLHGHSVVADLIVAGQHAITPNAYAHRGVAYQRDGAPVEFQPVNVPVVAEPVGLSVLCTAANAPGALLLQDFFLDPTGVQQVFVDVGRTPANAEKQEEHFEGEPIEAINGDIEAIVSEYDEWSSLWDEVLRGV